MEDKDKPEGVLKFHHVEIKENQKHALYYKVFFEDENGKLWSASGATFRFDLKPE